jgi:ferredoxin-like protein FixX
MPSIKAEYVGDLNIKCVECGQVDFWETLPNRFALVAVTPDENLDLSAAAALPVHIARCKGCGAIRLLEARSLGGDS